jgi:hypothetical protein
MARRIQRKRTKGWKMPPNTVYVGRPTQWGNWFLFYEMCDVSVEDGRKMAVDLFEKNVEEMINDYGLDCILTINKHFVTIREWLKPLRGKDLACFCPLDQPCHADVLLRLANAEEA